VLQVQGLECRASDLGVEVYREGFRIGPWIHTQEPGFGIRGLGFGFRGSGFGVQDARFGIRDSGFGIQDSIFEIRNSFFVFCVS